MDEIKQYKLIEFGKNYVHEFITDLFKKPYGGFLISAHLKYEIDNDRKNKILITTNGLSSELIYFERNIRSPQIIEFVMNNILNNGLKTGIDRNRSALLENDLPLSFKIAIKEKYHLDSGVIKIVNENELNILRLNGLSTFDKTLQLEKQPIKIAEFPKEIKNPNKKYKNITDYLNNSEYLMRFY